MGVLVFLLVLFVLFVFYTNRFSTITVKEMDMSVRFLIACLLTLFFSSNAFSSEKQEAQYLPAGTSIVFEKATEENFGTITVADGVLEVVYFDNSTALVRMGKFPVLGAKVISDSWVIIGSTDLKVTISSGGEKSRSRHRKWYDWSGWN